MSKRVLYEGQLKVIKDYMNNLCKNKEINMLINSLKEYGDLILIGGAVRDLIIKKSTPRDIDIIVNTNLNLDSLLLKYDTCFKNRFNGYKIIIDSLEFDIWSINDHWAFKNNIVEKNLNNLRNTTFLDFDSPWYNFTKEEGDIELFMKCLEKHQIDITLDPKDIELNPNAEINVLRMLAINNEWKLDFSEKVINYIVKWTEKNSKDYLEKLYNAQFRHYKYEKYDKELIRKLICKNF